MKTIKNSDLTLLFDFHFDPFPLGILPMKLMKTIIEYFFSIFIFSNFEMCSIWGRR